MSEPNYTAFGSRIVLDTLKPTEVGKKENIKDKTQHKSRDPLNVDMRFFTVKVNPTGDHKVHVEEALEKCFGQGFTVESRPSPTNTASDESFYSCRSANSQPEVREEGRREKPRPGTNGRRSKHSRDEELFNQLTMVNAIFLNNSVGQCVHEETRNAQGDKSHHRKSSYSTANAKCRARFSEDATFMDNVCGDSATMQRQINNETFAYFSGDNSLRERKWSPKMSSFKACSRGVKRVDSVTSINSDDSGKSLGKCVKLEDHTTKLSPKVPELLPKAKRKTVSSCGDSKLLHASDNMKYNGRLEMRKHEIRNGENVQFVETYFLKQSFVELLPKMDLSRPIAGKLKERDCSDLVKRGKVKTVKRLEKVDKMVLVKNLSLFKDPKLVSSIAKIAINPAAKRDKEETIEVSTTSDIVPKRRNAVSGNVREELEKALVFEKPLTVSCELALHDRSFALDEETDVVYMKENLTTVGRRKRRACRLISPLPVIREESSESIESNASVESNASDGSNKSEDYCLVDSLGRTIYLFDDNGLPLTDECGRPLRVTPKGEELSFWGEEETIEVIPVFNPTINHSNCRANAMGETLMRCDSQGVPLVDSSSKIFDHLGRHALDPKFSPWGVAPVPPSRRLCAPSGRPLLLFDSLGRPLTGASGALLLDRAGCPLLTLNA